MHRVAHLTGHNQTKPRTRAGLGGGGPVNHGNSRGCTASSPHDPAIVVTAEDAVRARQHLEELLLRPRARCAPCGDEPRGSRGPRGCACEGGSRALWHDGGYWAGTCACSWSDLLGPYGLRRWKGSCLSRSKTSADRSQPVNNRSADCDGQTLRGNEPALSPSLAHRWSRHADSNYSRRVVRPPS